MRQYCVLSKKSARTLLLLFLLCFTTGINAKNTLLFTYSLSGISGSAQSNVEKRLKELQHYKSLDALSDEEIRHQISNALQPYGYFKADIEITRPKTGEIILKIHPGSPMKITGLHIELLGEGAKNPLLNDTIHQLPLKLGAPLSVENYNQAKQDLAISAEHLGYLRGAFTQSELAIDETRYEAKITLIFNTGPQYYFGQVQFDPTYINPELLHRFAPFKPNQPYSSEKAIDFNNFLSGSGYFSSVVVQPQITDSPTVPVQVHLQPVPKYSYSLGAGFGTDTGVRGRAGLQVVPVNRYGHKFNTLAQGSQTQSAIQGQYLIPGANPVEDQYSVTGNYSSLNYDSGYSNSVLLSLAKQHNTQNAQRTVSINSLYESYHYSLQTNEDRFILYPKATFTLSQTQNQLFSPSGFNLTLNGLGASQATLSQVNFAQFSADAKAAFMIEPLRLRLYGHVLQGTTAISNINHLPLSLALMLGGTDNLKAQSFNSVGPGKITSYGGFELQKETFKNLYLVGFYDAGAVYNPTPKNVLYDIGGGIMWVSPIGPIKVGLAQSVNQRLESQAKNPRLVISMGPDL